MSPRHCASLFLIVLPLAGCTAQEVIHGTTTFASTPAVNGGTGALPATAMLCEHPKLAGVYYLALST
jgi:hypothetical protein